MSGWSPDYHELFSDNNPYLEEEDDEVSKDETCTICEKKVQVQIMKGTGVCSEKCRKARDGDVPHSAALMHAAEPVVVNYHKTDVTGIH